MNSSRKIGREYSPSLSIRLAALFIFLSSMNSLAQNPNSGTTTTGQILTVHITSPADGAVFPGLLCETDVTGVVTLSSAARTNVSVLYVLDVSGSTADPFAFPPVDVNGDGSINSGDDFNGDGSNGDILDAEIAGALALNGSIHNFDEVSVGMIAYASRAANADVSPAAGFQNFLSPPRTDQQQNNIPDIEEVFRSLDSHITQGGSIDLFTAISRDSLGNSTNFEAALQAMIAAFASRPTDEQKLVYFLSDGRNEIGGSIADEISQAAAAAIVVNTVGITSSSDPTLLTQIAQGTGGKFTQVNNPAELRVVLPTIPLVGIAEVRVNDQPVTLSAIGTFSTSIALAAGANVISATAIADDQTSVTASISATCGVEPLFCQLEIIEPPDGLVICGDQVTVRAVSRVSGGAPPITRQCMINGVPVRSLSDTLTATVTIGADNRIVVICTYTDAQNNTITCQDSVKVRRPEPLACAIEVLTPAAGTVICGDSIDVAGMISVTGGRPPFTINFNVNGESGTAIDGSFAARVPLFANNLILATSFVIDSCGNTTTCVDSVRIARPEPLACELEIATPEDGAFICDDSVDVSGVVSISGGAPRFSTSCDVNGIAAVVSGNTFSVRIPLNHNENLIIATATTVDSCGSVTMCFDSVVVNTTRPGECAIGIETPVDGALICADSIKVVARSGMIQISSLLPGVVCDINGVPADHVNGTFSAIVALTGDTTLIVATCAITDECGNTAVCRDSIRVLRPPAPVAGVQIISPAEGDLVCGDSLTVTATQTITGGFPPFTESCSINGVQATVTDSLISATVLLSAGENLIVAVCTVSDSCGRVTVSRDSITVFRDAVPPTCSFRNEGLNIKGTFSDAHSGIASFSPVRLKNSKLTVDPFIPGANTVNFLLEPIDPDKPTGFSIDIFDVCGNRFNCDPIFARLETNRARQIEFTFPSEDRYLEIINFGLTEVRIDLNGHKFQLTSDLVRTREPNTFFLERDGAMTIDLVNYLQAGENTIFIAYDGPAGAAADLFLLDHVHGVDFILDLKSLPAEFHLAQNYPNPFNPSTKIRIDIPERMSEGVTVQLRVYNLLGELVQTILDEHKLPGEYTIEWDGRNKSGEMVTSGIYLYQIVAGGFRETKRMLLLK